MISLGVVELLLGYLWLSVKALMLGMVLPYLLYFRVFKYY